ncbi:DUF3696 domain-containing protein [Chryseobacterium sp.]|uniref:DUF3696 domain-containing protein n=1 Tax=Chryseobacterium sp. TaxID=1871047 RepID=UPI00289C58E0|nr:DUF3696 domain-containing protein [Chryseobacterium sp.]
MINQVSFKNYKIFKDKQTIQLKPITILIGKNNTGKSAVLKLMTLIEGGLSGKNDKVFELNNDDVIIGNEFKDLIHGKFSRALDLELVDKSSKIDSYLKTSIIVDSNKDTPIIETWKLNKKDNEKSEELKLDLYRNSESSYINIIDDLEYSCYFDGIWLSKYHNSDNKLKEIIIQQPFLNTDFIGAIRDKAKLDYRLNSESIKSGIDGKYLYDFLIRDYLTTEKIYFNKVSNWISEKFEGWSLYIDVDSEPYHIRLRKGNLDIDLTESGMGISQSLPLITRAFKPCQEETLIIIEEPESHLHPYAHSQIAQLFAESVKEDRNKKYLIETHSQNFILRLRRLIAEGFLSADDLGIYYVDFDEEKNESNLIEVEIDEGGGVKWWPEGIFGETTIETRAIYNAQLNDVRNVDSDK